MVDPMRYEAPLRDIDLDHPSVARIYDYLLGGETNWAIDREFADKMIESYPLVCDMAKANRSFLHRVVRYLVHHGVRQFVDIGAGVPTMGNTHEIAQDAAADCRVVYVDNEPIAVAHADALLWEAGSAGHHAVINGDLRSPDQLWRQVERTGILDLAEPIAVLIIAVLHVQQPGPDGTDIGPYAVSRYRELLSPGSYLAISHVTDDGVPDTFKADLRDIKRMYDGVDSPVVWRSREQIRALFGDFHLVEPGMSWAPQWHPEEAIDQFKLSEFATPNKSVIWAGVAKKP